MVGEKKEWGKSEFKEERKRSWACVVLCVWKREDKIAKRKRKRKRIMMMMVVVMMKMIVEELALSLSLSLAHTRHSYTLPPIHFLLSDFLQTHKHYYNNTCTLTVSAFLVRFQLLSEISPLPPSPPLPSLQTHRGPKCLKWTFKLTFSRNVVLTQCLLSIC